MTADDGKVYVYGLSEPGLPATLRVLGHRLRVLSMGRVDAIVAQPAAAVEPTPEALREQHAIVARMAARSRALLPARFGSAIDESTLRGIVADRERSIIQALARVRGRQQMTIRVFGTPDATVPEVNRTTTGTAFLKGRQALARHVPPEVAEIRAALGPLVTAEVVEPGRAGLRVTLFHLVPTGRVAAYKKRAAALRVPPHQLTVTGPWPAFAFAPDLF